MEERVAALEATIEELDELLRTATETSTRSEETLRRMLAASDRMDQKLSAMLDLVETIIRQHER